LKTLDRLTEFPAFKPLARFKRRRLLTASRIAARWQWAGWLFYHAAALRVAGEVIHQHRSIYVYA
jgi:hypothetical protein